MSTFKELVSIYVNTSCFQNVLQSYSLIYLSPLEGNNVITSVL